VRTILHIHIPAFSIAVARVSQPALRDRPVVVAPRSERALVLSVSPEARKEGLYKGMSLSKAVKRCPELTLLSPDPLLTERAGRALVETAARYTPLWEPLGPGHIWLDMTGTGRLWGRAKDTAFRLRQEIKNRLYLSGTVGMAGNKMVSGIASKFGSSQEVVDVVHGEEASFMAPLKVGVVPGIGRFGQRPLLEELHITRVRELAALDMGRLKLIFGRQAPVIHQRALGVDFTPVYPGAARPVVSEGAPFPEDEEDDQRLLGALYTLVEACGRRLRKRGLFPRKAGLVIRYADQVEVTRRVALARGSPWDFDLYEPVEGLFFKVCTRRVRVRYMRVWFQDFSCAGPQLSLFPGPPQEKRARAIQATDRIRERHGKTAIYYAGTA